MQPKESPGPGLDTPSANFRVSDDHNGPLVKHESQHNQSPRLAKEKIYLKRRPNKESHSLGGPGAMFPFKHGKASAGTKGRKLSDLG